LGSGIAMTKRAKSPRRSKASRGRATKSARSKSARTKTVRSKSVGAKATRSGAARAKSASAAPEVLDQLIAAAAHALALPVEAAWKGAVKANLQVTLRLAASFADFPLPDDAEPAPVFTA
jgi:1-carboxybiuret hydrolase subunit AtzG-like